MSIIVPSRHTGIGAWVNSNLYTSVLYNFINFPLRVVFFYLVTTGWIFYISLLCKNSIKINQTINACTPVATLNAVS